MKHLLVVLAVLTATASAFGGGRVLFVIGSDTGLWTGLNVSEYRCSISGALYSNPAMNAARVMDPAFRSALTDKHGTPMRLTWWMMAGNMFRLSVNTDIPVPSTMPVYLMKRFHGDRLQQWGDELTFHFHTWVWTDYNNDGVWYWNQAKTYAEYAGDFEQTLAELLLEEEVFPVSFRSGWHAMDNDWQRRLDRLLPYSMHNDWPAVHADATEPIDNVYDWSRASSAFIPFHPSSTDYQVPGDCKGWNVRSEYITSGDSSFIAKIFNEAAKGTDQVVCLWAHLPETDFPDNLVKVNAAIHAAATRFPAIDYRYCTAVEAMQAWRTTSDTTRPELTVTDEGPDATWVIRTNEPLFQPDPFVAVKDRYAQYHILTPVRTGAMEWKVAAGIPSADIATVGVAVTDTAGNHTIRIIRLLPDDIIVDDRSAGYAEPFGSWSTVTGSGFDASYRVSSPAIGDSAVAQWSFTVPSAGMYNVFIRIPATTPPPSAVRIQWGLGGTDMMRTIATPIPVNIWQYLGLVHASAPASGHVTMSVGGHAGGIQCGADAIRISALVRDRWIEAPDSFDAGALVVGEGSAHSLAIKNSGVQEAHVTGVVSAPGAASITDILPLTLQPMDETSLHFLLTPPVAGSFRDTLVLATDDPHHPHLRMVIHAAVREYFTIADDKDTAAYRETGSWAFSSAGGFNATSRYAYPAPGVSATFTTRLKRSGVYDISAIVPTTVNASVRARYLLLTGTTPTDSMFRDQNEGSGAWVRLWQRTLPADSTVTLRITDAMAPVIAGKVLRADAVQFQWIATGTTAVRAAGPSVPSVTSLMSNFPNPFNPSTHIPLSIVKQQRVQVAVFDLLGRQVATLVDGVRSPGTVMLRFDADGLSSGVYVARLCTDEHVQTIRMLLMK